MKIIWSDDAKHDYDENIEYLLSEWSEESAIYLVRFWNTYKDPQSLKF